MRGQRGQLDQKATPPSGHSFTSSGTGARWGPDDRTRHWHEVETMHTWNSGGRTVPLLRRVLWGCIRKYIVERSGTEYI